MSSRVHHAAKSGVAFLLDLGELRFQSNILPDKLDECGGWRSRHPARKHATELHVETETADGPDFPGFQRPCRVQQSTIKFLSERNCPTRRNKPHSRASCRGEASNVRTSEARTNARCARAIARIRGTITPRKRSPSPYSPCPVLKNRRSTDSFSGDAASRSSRRMEAATVMAAPCRFPLRPPGGSHRRRHRRCRAP